MSVPFKAAIAILGLLLLALFGVWLVVGSRGLLSKSTPQAEPQETGAPTPAPQPHIPRLDAAATAETETAGAVTATFALG